MTTVVAVTLAFMNTSLKNIHQQNEAVFNKRAVLKAFKSIPEVDAMSDDEVIAFFDKSVEQNVVNMDGKSFTPDEVKTARNFKDKVGKAEDLDLSKEKKKDEKDRLHPLYIYKEGSKKTYITAVRGSGLWDEIWGYIALEEDESTIKGVSFDHKGETPGLGAEIKDNPTFPLMFKEKKIRDAEGKFVSINVKKGGADKANPHAVDGISGATVTCDGVTEMLERGLGYYESYFAKN